MEKGLDGLDKGSDAHLEVEIADWKMTSEGTSEVLAVDKNEWKKERYSRYDDRSVGRSGSRKR